MKYDIVKLDQDITNAENELNRLVDNATEYDKLYEQSVVTDKVIAKYLEAKQYLENEKKNRENIQVISDALKNTFQKVGMVKYDAFHEMGGKLSFSLALLDQKNDGFIINAMHSREGCYTYIKEILNGNSIIVLAEEEKEALGIAMGTDKKKEDDE